MLFRTDYTIYTLPIFDRVRVRDRARFNVQVKYSNFMIFKNSLSASCPVSSHSTVLRFGCGQRFGSIALTGVSKCKKMFSAGIITVNSQPTFRLHSVSIASTKYPRWERFKPFSVGGRTAFPCVLMQFNHWECEYHQRLM